MASISVIILTKNEEKNIGRCLGSLGKIADEILVLDSGSTDRTIEISEKAGAKVIQVEWKGYGATKNEGAVRASSAYLLFLDADEALSEEMYLFILTEKEMCLPMQDS